MNSESNVTYSPIEQPCSPINSDENEFNLHPSNTDLIDERNDKTFYSDQISSLKQSQQRQTRRVCSMSGSFRTKMFDRREQLSINDMWLVFQKSISDIFSCCASNYSQESLYTLVENCCKLSSAVELDKRVKIHLENIITNQMLFRFEEILKESNEFLSRFWTEWTLFWERLYKVRTIFLLVDKEMSLVQSDRVHISIWDHGIQLFRREIMEKALLSERVLSIFFQEIFKERATKTMLENRHDLRNICTVFTALNIYMSELHPRFLAASREFYNKETELLCQQLNSAQYLTAFLQTQASEISRISAYLERGHTETPLMRILVSEWIESRYGYLVDQGLPWMFNDSDFTGLSNLYSVLSMTIDQEGLARLKSVFFNLLKKLIMNIVQNLQNDPEKDRTMIQELLDMRQKAETVFRNCWQSNEDLSKAIREAFVASINHRSHQIAQFLAKHVDQLLRNGVRALPSNCNENELDNELDKVMAMFRYVNGKDVFKAFFRQDLAKRLLLDKSASIDAERSMLSKLKHECGSAYTTEMETMFQDVELSSSLSREFRISLNNKLEMKTRQNSETCNQEDNICSDIVDSDFQHTTDKNETTSILPNTQGLSTSTDRGNIPDLNDLSLSELKLLLCTELMVCVIRPSAWPTYKLSEVHYPIEMLCLKSQFEKFYTDKHNGRKLHFLPSMGFCTLRTRFENDKPHITRELLLSEMQALILLQFNHNRFLITNLDSDVDQVHSKTIKSITASALFKAVGGERTDFDRAILSISMVKSQRILLKKPLGSQVEDSDEFRLNNHFTHKAMRIKLNNIQIKETKEEVKLTEDSIWQNRKVLVDCNIVRLMKTRRELEHSELVISVQRQLNFPCAIADIKRRIDDLIERNYISRDVNSKSRYIYVA